MTKDRLSKLLELQRRIRSDLRTRMGSQSIDVLSRSERDEERGDTIFAIDVAAEEVLLPFCEEWGKQECFVLIAEGVEPEIGRVFGRPGASGPAFRLISDPIDGSRGLMFDKRSAWSLAAIAPDRGEETALSDVTCAVMTELPTTRQAASDVLWAERGHGVHGERHNLIDGTSSALSVAPSQRTELLHGFATVVNFFQGGKDLTSRIDEEIVRAERGGWNPEKAEVYTDQYISSGGALAEIMLGRDRFVMDIRPWVHRALGIESSLCSRPYDLCTVLVAQEAGCVVTAPDGSALDGPLDVATNMSFVAYANPALAARLQPIVTRVLHDHGLV